MSNMKIDSDLLSVEISKLEAVTKEMETLFSNIKKETDSLKDCWETRTSEGVYNDFDAFYKILDSVKNTNQQDANFLKNVVNTSYVDFENNTNTLVDNNIAI